MLKLQAYIDCCYLDIETLNYKPRMVVASFMYLTLALEYEQFTKEFIYYEIPKTSKFILVDCNIKIKYKLRNSLTNYLLNLYSLVSALIWWI